MTRPRRILVVTAGLVAAGAVFGAIAGAIAVVISVMLAEDPAAVAEPTLYLIGAYFGAPIGAVSLPIVAWVLLRRVPLGRVILGSVVGTVLGGVAGWILPVMDDQVLRGLLGAGAGFLAAAVLMSLRPAPGAASRPPLES
jgi:hypothetical protein